MESTSSEGPDSVERDKSQDVKTSNELEMTKDASTNKNMLELSVEELIANAGPLELYVGMEFESLDDAWEYYNAYARRKGFSIRKNHTQLSRVDKALIAVSYVCSREGHYVKKNSKGQVGVLSKAEKTRTGCKAILKLSRRNAKTWVVTKFIDEHNHELSSPMSTSLLQSHKRITPAQRKVIDAVKVSGLSASSIMPILTKESDGNNNVGETALDIQNYLGSEGRMLLKVEDAQRMLRYFEECQAKNPGFVYAVQLDSSGHMSNCFWADARSRMAYQYFGDVVIFDAIYMRNSYALPFVPFTGVNHHNQSIMFGCALFLHETEESFVWLLQTWLETMFLCPPTTIITNQDATLTKAIAQVLPKTNHQICLWHILEKVSEHLGHELNRHPTFQNELNSCIHNTVTVDEFESAWMNLNETYDLRNKDFLKKLYDIREKWVPAYVRNTFCAGISTTQRSESMHKYFKQYVSSKTLLRDFVHQYEKALDAQDIKEREKDVKSRNYKPTLRTLWHIEEEVANKYTRKVFLKFQEELFGSQNHGANKIHQEGAIKTYRVLTLGRQNPAYNITFDASEMKAVCTCHKFEFVGILCRHVLAVFIKKNVISLPSHYILLRWTINAKRHRLQVISSSVVQASTQRSSMLRRNNLMVQFLEISELASQSQKHYDHSVLVLRQLRDDLLAVETEDDEITWIGCLSNGRTCTLCKTPGHNKRSCPEARESGGSSALPTDTKALGPPGLVSALEPMQPPVWYPPGTQFNVL